MNQEELIERCKQEIEYRAKYMCLDFDREDIEALVTEWGTVIALTHQVFEIKDAETGEILSREKRPLLWAEWTKVPQETHQKWNEVKLTLPVPIVHLRNPHLVIIILPNGEVKKTDIPLFLQQKYTEEVREWVFHLSSTWP